MVPDLAVERTGYVVVWRNGKRWVGHKVHMDFNQEAYDAECSPGQSPGNRGQTNAAQARRHITILRKA